MATEQQRPASPSALLSGLNLQDTKLIQPNLPAATPAIASSSSSSSSAAVTAVDEAAELRARIAALEQANQQQQMQVQQLQYERDLVTGAAYRYQAPADEIKRYNDLAVQFDQFIAAAHYFAAITIDDIGMIEEVKDVKNCVKAHLAVDRKSGKSFEEFHKPLVRFAHGIHTLKIGLKNAAVERFQSRDLTQQHTVQQGQKQLTLSIKQQQQAIARNAKVFQYRHNFLNPLPNMQDILRSQVDDQAVEDNFC